MIASKDIVFLLGAGASADAGILTSEQMIRSIEERLIKDWQPFAGLYYHVKSAIFYSAGLKGIFSDSVTYNIETLVNALYELERNEEHPLYPFIAAWNLRFVALAGQDFGQVRAFRRGILAALKDWMCPQHSEDSGYYKGFVQVQASLNFPLQIFSLNYDTCVERLAAGDFAVETGFSGFGPRHLWSWRRFIESDRGSNPLPQVFLYKLHGSIDWVRDAGSNQLFRLEQIQTIRPDQMEIIFGREFKLEAADPYLFYAYAFRQATFDAKLIVCVGYGFADEHINKMLSQALQSDPSRRLLVVARCEEEKASNQRRESIGKTLAVSVKQMIVEIGTAKTFLGSEALGKRLVDLVPETGDSPF